MSAAARNPIVRTQHRAGAGGSLATQQGATGNRSEAPAETAHGRFDHLPPGRVPLRSARPAGAPALAIAHTDRSYSSSHRLARSVPWKWLGDMVQPLIFLL